MTQTEAQADSEAQAQNKCKIHNAECKILRVSYAPLFFVLDKLEVVELNMTLICSTNVGDDAHIVPQGAIKT